MTLGRPLLAGAIAIALVSAVACGPDDRTVRRAVQHALDASAAAIEPEIASAVAEWYAASGMRLTWDGRRAEGSLAGFEAALLSHGLDPEHYGWAAIAAGRANARGSSAQGGERLHEEALLDIRTTAAILHAGRDVALGQVRPDAVRRGWLPARPVPELVGSLTQARNEGDLSSWLDRLAPVHPEYAQLRRWLAELRPTGPSSHVDRVRANLDRWRWVPDDFGSRHIVVNVPEFVLRARERGETVLDMRVVVGKPNGHETPLFSAAIETVVFNPYWNIPESIVLSETVPALTKDPEYLERQNIEVLKVSAKGTSHVDPRDVDWSDPDALRVLHIRQQPGDGNALGQVKFLFPNQHAVYLHDTPSKALFARDSRAFSHGCVRVADPRALAEYVLEGTIDGTPQRIAHLLDRDDEAHVAVREGIPVHLVYFTVVAGPDGQPRFLKDIYRIDERQIRLH